jgi:DNA repair exonuclease SbcCD ATPase subunit
MAGPKDESLSRTGPLTRSKAGNSVPQNLHSLNFLKLVERTTDNFVGGDDTAVEDVRRILLQVRSHYDSVHHEAEQKEAQLKKMKEQIRAADASYSNRADETHRLEDSWGALQDKFDETNRRITETKTSKKVYEHMLARIQKEQAILRQKMLKMEEHISRKRMELNQRRQEAERVHGEKVQGLEALESLERDASTERETCLTAREVMDGELDRRKEANKRRADFESWRHEVALEAANEAFNASAGRLRKLYAIEKLAGNMLQKITFEQVERSQTTENGFQKIRDVTGLADVMDIVHKFLNREVEHEQLRASVKDAEVRLEALRQDFDGFKRQTEGITFDSNTTGRPGEIYKEVEETEKKLSDSLKDHEACRMRLAKTTLQVEDMKRWTARVGQLLSAFEESVQVQSPTDLPLFFDKLEVAVERFIAHVTQQIGENKVTRKILSQVSTRENNEQARLLANEQFLKSNCRVPASADHRPSSARGGVDDDPDAQFAADRDSRKNESGDKVREAQAEVQKKRQKER